MINYQKMISKKFWLTIAINICLITIGLFCFEFFVYLMDYYLHGYKLDNKHRLSTYSLNIETYDHFYNDHKKEIFRKPSGLSYRKRPIILFGCSYTYGSGLNENQTFSHKLSELTKRPVYNRGICGGSLQHMIYQLDKDSDLNRIKNPEYIIYTFFPGQISRLHLFSFQPFETVLYLKYKETNHRLAEEKPLCTFLYRFYSIRTLDSTLGTNKSLLQNQKNRNENFDLIKLFFTQAKKQTDKKYPGAKFVILIYNDFHGCWYVGTPRWKELEKEGFIVINTDDLTRANLELKKYKLKDTHPNETAWNIITPSLAKKLKL